MKPNIIIGTGLAGYTVAREWRKYDAERPLLMLTKDDGAFYSKPMLSNALSQGKAPAELATANGQKMAADLNADIQTHTGVAQLLPEEHQIKTEHGETLEYNQLVLAVGASPIRAPIQGDAADAVLSVNSLEDYTQFREQLANKTRVLVIGPGLIGCEFANDLVANGYEVTVVGPSALPLDRLLPEVAGKQLQTELARQGVVWQLGTVVETVNRSGDALRVELANGTVIDTDIVLSAIGLRPNIQLADTAGLKTGRGIIVDRLLATSQEDVFAVGDCAEVCGYLLPFVMPLMNAARALAKTLAGEPTPVRYPAMPVVVKTPAYPIVVLPPRDKPQGQWHIETKENGVMARFLDDQDRLRGFVVTGGMVAEKNALLKSIPPLLD
jgi:rubredoxin-NAD+ reductase